MSQQLQIQVGSQYRGWETVKAAFDDPALLSDLDANIKALHGLGLIGDGWEGRILNANGDVLAHFVRPYEGAEINFIGMNADTLEVIREDYGINKAQFAGLCRAWLEAHAE
jgi:hypothetical protein